MADGNEKRSNRALGWGLLLAVLGFLSNGLYFLGFPAAPVSWISLFLPLIGFCLVVAGLWRAFARSTIYRGKVWGTIATILSGLILAASVTFFVGARRLPSPSAATPQVGQRVPDFTLPDSEGHPVALSQLLLASAGGAPPKAVLLVFYRGYW
jgi:hypothetical protein